MRGKRAKQLRKAAGGQEITTERKYGYVPKEKGQKNRVYDIQQVERMDSLTGKVRLTGPEELVINPKTKFRNYKLAPLHCMSEGRRRVNALKKHFYENSRAS